MKQKLVHIHSDKKFLNLSKDFVHESFENQIVYLGDETPDSIKKLQNTEISYKIFNADKLTSELLTFIENSDAIFLYNLEDTKIDILKNISSTKKTFLFLFGYELYGLLSHRYLGTKTLKIFKDRSVPKRKLDRIKEFFSKEKAWHRHFKQFNKVEQKNLYSKLDAILLLNNWEYQELSKNFHLPPLVLRSISSRKINIIERDKKKKNIIIGNSEHIWNNHLDILPMIENSNDVTFSMFFNYGVEPNFYTKKVKEESSRNNNIHLIEKFLDYEEFENIYKESAALVINSYRQHAVWNIFTALEYGCKVYLNPRSSTYHWLKAEGFAIFNISQLRNDIKTNQIFLTEKDQTQNIKAMEMLQEKRSQNNFIQAILKYL